jgi:Holliday junction resolvasome RuvABC endonuclease subunit
VAELIRRYRPHVIAVEDCASASLRRHARIRELLDQIRRLAREKRIAVADFTPARVRRAFAPKKDVIAAGIAGRFPELAPRLPRARALGNSEQEAMPLFDAMALALTFFYFRNRKTMHEQRRSFAFAASSK